MEQKLREGAGRILPKRLAKNMVELYKHGRAKLISARYGNPAGTVRVIAVTGEYGKTTTAKLIAELLKEAGRTVVVATEEADSADNAGELQRQLKEAKKDGKEFFILEVTSALVASSGLSGVAIDTVVVTSKNAEAEVLLGQAISYAVVPDDHAAGMLAIAEHQIISFGEHDEAEAKIDEVTLYRKGTEVKLTIDHHTALTIATHLIGKANAYNLAAAVATAYVLGVALDTVEEGAARLEKSEGNYQYVPGDRPYTMIVDSAQTDRSVELVAESAKELAKRRLIVGLEVAGVNDETVARLKKLSDRLVLVSATEMALPGVDTVTSAEEAVLIAQRTAKKDDTVLLMGDAFVQNSRQTELETEK